MQFKYFYNVFRVFFEKDFDIFFTKYNKIILIFYKKSVFELIEVPNFVFVKKVKDNIFFKFLAKDFSVFPKFVDFHRKVSHMLQRLDNKKYKKHLVIKGLGMRVKYFRFSNKLQLKLGFSNLILLNVPAGIEIYRNKDVLIIEGKNRTTVGNFANLVRSLKIPDSYKGKGIWYKNESRFLKPIKKI
jgi:hypothetical protein